MDKTILEDFKTKYPNAPLYSDGTPKMCVLALGYEEYEYCNNTTDKIGCIECWNRMLKEITEIDNKHCTDDDIWDDDEWGFDNYLSQFVPSAKIKPIVSKNKKKLKIPEVCKVCVNCESYYEDFYECDLYDCRCMMHHRNTTEDDSCEYWKWNGWQLVLDGINLCMHNDYEE